MNWLPRWNNGRYKISDRINLNKNIPLISFENGIFIFYLNIYGKLRLLT